MITIFEIQCKASSLTFADTDAAAGEKSAKQQAGKRLGKRKRQAAGAEEEGTQADGAAHKKRQPEPLPGSIFSEATLPGLSEGLPAHPSSATQLPGMAAMGDLGDLPDDLPAEPLVFWPPSAAEAAPDPGHIVQVGNKTTRPPGALVALSCMQVQKSPCLGLSFFLTD